MILCDECSNWYHFDCVGVKAKELKKIKEYKCITCLDHQKNSTKEVNFKDSMEVEEIPEEEFVQSSTPQKNLKVFFFIC
jgi:hypothetical protein